MNHYDTEPFDLKRCMAGEPVVTGYGEEFIFIALDTRACDDLFVIGLVDGIPTGRTESGHYPDDYYETLYMKVPKKENKLVPHYLWFQRANKIAGWEFIGLYLEGDIPARKESAEYYCNPKPIKLPE